MAAGDGRPSISIAASARPPLATATVGALLPPSHQPLAASTCPQNTGGMYLAPHRYQGGVRLSTAPRAAKPSQHAERLRAAPGSPPALPHAQHRRFTARDNTSLLVHNESLLGSSLAGQSCLYLSIVLCRTPSVAASSRTRLASTVMCLQFHRAPASPPGRPAPTIPCPQPTSSAGLPRDPRGPASGFDSRPGGPRRRASLNPRAPPRRTPAAPVGPPVAADTSGISWAAKAAAGQVEAAKPDAARAPVKTRRRTRGRSKHQVFIHAERLICAADECG